MSELSEVKLNIIYECLTVVNGVSSRIITDEMWRRNPQWGNPVCSDDRYEGFHDRQHRSLVGIDLAAQLVKHDIRSLHQRMTSLISIYAAVNRILFESTRALGMENVKKAKDLEGVRLIAVSTAVDALLANDAKIMAVSGETSSPYDFRTLVQPNIVQLKSMCPRLCGWYLYTLYTALDDGKARLLWTSIERCDMTKLFESEVPDSDFVGLGRHIANLIRSYDQVHERKTIIVRLNAPPIKVVNSASE